MPMVVYNDLLAVIEEEKYLLTALLGKWSNHREEAARTLVHITDSRHKSREFLFSVIDQEISSTSEHPFFFFSFPFFSSFFPFFPSTISPFVVS